VGRVVNYIWLGMIVFSIIVASMNGHIEIITKAALEGAGEGVKTSLHLISIIAFWLGLMRIAEAAGLVQILASIMRPLTRILFPDLPRDHPALGAIIMNISANILGLGNAATPMGLIAMQELQKINNEPKTASPSMCTFLALNTSCLTLIPSTIIGIRLLHNSSDPTSVVGTTIFATACGMIVGVSVDRLMRFIYRVQGR